MTQGCVWLDESCTMDGTDYDCTNPAPPSKDGSCDYCLFGGLAHELERRKTAPVWDDLYNRPAHCEICQKVDNDTFQRGDFVWVCTLCYWKGDVPL